MEITFKKAKKSQAKLRLGLAGPSGSGKTYTALSIARFLGSKVAVIDTERASSQLYAHEFPGFEFDSADLPDFKAETYIEAIKVAAKNGVDALIIDSWSHAWEQLKDRVDGIAKAKFKGSSWGAWSELTPIQNALVEAILQYPGHVIACLRTKTAWELEKDDRTGKTKPVKVGLAPIQREGVDHEFTIFMEMSEGGIAHVGKTRWSAIADKVIEKPGEAFAKELLGWLNEGEPVAAKPFAPAIPAPQERAAPPSDGRRERAILLEKIQAALMAKWPGQSIPAKRAKAELLMEVFGTPSWKEVSGLAPEILSVKFEQISRIISGEPVETSPPDELEEMTDDLESALGKIAVATTEPSAKLADIGRVAVEALASHNPPTASEDTKGRPSALDQDGVKHGSEAHATGPSTPSPGPSTASAPGAEAKTATVESGSSASPALDTAPTVAATPIDEDGGGANGPTNGAPSTDVKPRAPEPVANAARRAFRTKRAAKADADEHHSERPERELNTGDKPKENLW